MLTKKNITKSVLMIIFTCEACTWQGQPCQLLLHYESGFTLLDASEQQLWSYPFERLRSSSDDTTRLLWLDFGSEDEQVRFLAFYKLWILIINGKICIAGAGHGNLSKTIGLHSSQLFVGQNPPFGAVRVNDKSNLSNC